MKSLPKQIALGTDAAAQARALMARFNQGSQFNHKAFLAEMETRSWAFHNRPLLKKEQRLLARIVNAYLAELS